jgi:hypothetical protein
MGMGETLTWEWDFYEDGTPYKHRKWEFTLTAAGFTYSTPAGTFDNCVLISVHEYTTYGECMMYSVWAAGVGPIMRLTLEELEGSDPEVMWLLVDDLSR